MQDNQTARPTGCIRLGALLDGLCRLPAGQGGISRSVEEGPALCLWFKQVADSTHVDDIARVGWVELDLFPQAMDVPLDDLARFV